MDNTRLVVDTPDSEIPKLYVAIGLLFPPAAALACNGLSFVFNYIYIEFGLNFCLDLLSVIIVSFPVQIVLYAVAFITPIVLMPKRLLMSAFIGCVELAFVLAIWFTL